MCWKYEEKYKACTDHLFFNTHDDPEVLSNLAEWLEAEINREAARDSFEELMTMWHEKGIMKPK